MEFAGIGQERWVPFSLSNGMTLGQEPSFQSVKWGTGARKAHAVRTAKSGR